MTIDNKKEIITIKLEKELKDKIINQSNIENKTISEFIRDSINKELTDIEISKNQSHLYNILDTIIKNILDEKFITINTILKSLYIKQELIINLLKTFDENEFEPEIEEFTTTYLEDNLRTIL